MDLRELQQGAKKEEGWHYEYRGIPIYCTEGVHEAIFHDFESLQKDKAASILVLGAGSGAFERRLADSGYTNITAVDFLADNKRTDIIKFIERDLNKNFSDLGIYDAVFAIEVIEHLENQFHFVRCLKEVISEGGVCYLSTPNVENTFARWKYFLTGDLHWFSQGQLLGTGHINPIFKHIFLFNLSQSKLRIEKYFTNNDVWEMALKNPSLTRRIAYRVMRSLSSFMKNRDVKDIKIFKISHE